MFDIIIIGAGPAGCTAAVYARRFNLKTLLIYNQPGGLIATAHRVENWPGIESISGFELGQTLFNHAVKVGAETIQAHIEGIKKKDQTFIVQNGGQKYKAKTVLVASGTFPRKLNVPGENELLGKGVSYCATCDATFFRGKTVAVIGGSDSVCNEADLLSQYADKVYLVYRRDKLRAEDVNVRAVESNPKVEIIYQTIPAEINGENKVESVTLSNNQKLMVDGVFVAIGREPLIGILDDVDIDFTERGEIKIDQSRMTKTPGLFAAGDVTPGIKQAITAAAYGVEAVFGVREYLKTLKC